MNNELIPLFNQNDKCYDIHGNELQYIAFVNGAHYVLKVYADDDGQIIDSEPVVLARVYSLPPVSIRNAEIVKIDEKISAMNRSLHEKQTKALKLDRTLKSLDQQFKDSLARIKECEELTNIDLFLAGGITHFVMGAASLNAEVVIKTFDEAINYVDRDDHKTYQRLLSLYGDSKRKVTWGIAHYGDGSGRHEHAIPFASYEEALKKAVEIHTGKLTSVRDFDFNKSPHVYHAWAKTAEKLGVDIPADIAENIRVRSLLLAKKELERLESAHHKAAASVASARSILAGMEEEKSGS